MTGVNDKVAVYLSPTEAEQFKLFCQHYDLFSSLLDAKVPELRNGSATLHFNPDAKLMTITINVISFRRKTVD